MLKNNKKIEGDFKYLVKNKKGITLIALVITIIVLLILAGVSINAVIGENGIATKAKNSKVETRIGDVKETIDLWKTEVYAQEEVDWENVMTEDEMLQKLIDDGKVKESEINRTDKIITINGKEIAYSIEDNNPYEIRAFREIKKGYYNWITLYNKDTEKYEEFGERVVIELESGFVFDGDVSEYMTEFDEDFGFPAGTSVLLLELIPEIEGSCENAKITIYKNDKYVEWNGGIFAHLPK